jgi:hypothetical protein
MESSLNATFEVDENAWKTVEDRFAEKGVPGGFSFTASEPQGEAGEGVKAVIRISADAAAFNDQDREQAWVELSKQAPAQANRLYQFSATDIARVIIEVWPELALALGIELTGSVLYEASSTS